MSHKYEAVSKTLMFSIKTGRYSNTVSQRATISHNVREDTLRLKLIDLAFPAGQLQEYVEPLQFMAVVANAQM